VAVLAWALVVGAAAAGGWMSIGPDGACDVQHPPRHRVESARDTFARREDLSTVEEATRARALQALLGAACADRTGPDCAAVRGAAGTDVAVDLDRRLVCAAALVAAEVVDDPSGATDHEAEVRRAAGALALALDGAPVGLLDVRWSTGCGAGEAGDRLAALLRRELLGAGVALTDGDGERVLAQIAPGDPATVELWRHRPGQAGRLAATARLSAGWLRLLGATGDQCHGDAPLGLQADARPGARGLRVELEAPVGGGLCPGEQIDARLRPSAPAVVQVWSVGRTGEAWLTWSSAADPSLDGGVVDRSATLRLEGAHLPALGEERLVVIAGAPGARLLPGSEGCRSPRLPALPAEAAVATAPFTVLPPGRGRCPALAPAAPDWSVWQSAPPCR
jgi:hypothetical protein